MKGKELPEVDPKKRAEALAAAVGLIEGLCERTGDWNLSAPELLLLLRLRIGGAVAQQKLEDLTRMTKSANSRYIARFGEGFDRSLKRGLGYIAAEPDPMNRKTNIVKLTPLGESVMDEAATRAARLIR